MTKYIWYAGLLIAFVRLLNSWKSLAILCKKLVALILQFFFLFVILVLLVEVLSIQLIKSVQGPLNLQH